MKICQFCQKETVYVPQKSSANYAFKAYFCYNCKVEYIDNSITNTQYSIYTKINNKTYRFSVYKDYAILWFIAYPGIPGLSLNRGSTIIKYFDYIISLTPDNIEEKIETILTFI